jgi:hypothetical protein
VRAWLHDIVSVPITNVNVSLVIDSLKRISVSGSGSGSTWGFQFCGALQVPILMSRMKI